MKIATRSIIPILLAVLATLNLVSAHSTLADTIIETTSSWNGTDGISNFGEPDTGTYGQTVTVPASDTVLTSFSVWIDDHNDPDAVDFAAYVMAWDGSKATGPILYQSAPQTTTNNQGAGGFEKFTFFTGGISLTAGAQYVIFVSASNFFDTVQGTSAMGEMFSNPYSGGDFVFYNNGSDFSALTTNGWDFTGGGGDLAFQASFTAPPCFPPPPNMIAWWRADGNADDSVDGHNGSLMAGATFAAGEVGQAFSLDGASAHVAVGDVDLPATFTIDAWIKPTDLSSNPRIFSKDDDVTARGYELRATAAGYLEATVTNGTGGLTFYRTNTPPIVTGSFQHVAVTYDGGAATNEKFKFYVNGTNIPASPVIANDAGGTPNNNSVAALIGIAGNRETGPFNGLIDEVEVFDRVLSSAEIQGISNAGGGGKCECTPPPDNMVGWWPGDENFRDIVNDNDGTPGGGVTFTDGKVNQAFQFNGTNGYVSFGNPPELNFTSAFSVDAWVRPDVDNHFSPNFRTIVSKWSQSGNNSWGVFMSQYVIAVYVTGSGGTAGVSAGPIPFGPGAPYTHVAVTYSSTDGLKVYLNGILTSSAAAVGTVNVGSDNVQLGNDTDFISDRWFPGAIDEVELFDRALLDSEVAKIYRAGSAGKCRPCTPAPSEMTHWWPGDGNANDIAGSNSGTLKNGASFSGGKVSGAFSLDGVDDYVDVGDVDLPTTFTIDAWINPDDLSNNPMIISNMDGSNGYYVLVLSTGQLLALVRHDASEDTVYITGPVITTGSWQHVTVTYDGNAGPDAKFKFYVDGQSVAANTSVDDGGDPGPSTFPATIGAYQGVTEFFNGLIDEVETFSRVLGPSEIAAIYDAGSGGKCKPVGPAERQLANISSRVDVGTGENVGIGGFIIRTDPGPTRQTSAAVATKSVLIRGLGPSLQAGGNPLTGRLLDPVLDLYDSNGTLIDHNDNWMEEPDGVSNPGRTAAIQATGLAPTDPSEAALLDSLITDSGYTAILSGKDASTGIGLVEVYDLEPTTDTHLANISTRAFVSTGDGVLIGGFIVEGGSPTRMLVRAIGPSLPPSVANRLEDPVLELRDANGALLELNDDWGNSPEATDIGNILPPGNSKDSAILFTPAPGGYTAIVSGNNPNPTGVALVETYRVTNP